MPSPTPDDEAARIYARVRADLERERGIRAWLRARPTPLRVAMLLSAATAISALGAWVLAGGLADRSATGWVSATGLVVALAFAVIAALRPIHLPEGSDASRALLVLGIALSSLAAIVASGDGTVGALASGRCALIGLAVGVPVFAVSLLVARHPSRGAVFRGLVGGIAGALAVQLVCPAPGLAHLVVEHFGVVLLGAVLFGSAGALFARRAHT